MKRKFIQIMHSISMTDSLLLGHCTRISGFIQTSRGCIIVLSAATEGLAFGYIVYLILLSYIAAIVAFGISFLFTLNIDMQLSVSFSKRALLGRAVLIGFSVFVTDRALLLKVLEPDVQQAIQTLYLDKAKTAHAPVKEANSRYEGSNAALANELRDAEMRLRDLEGFAAQEGGGRLGGSLARKGVSNVIGKAGRYDAAMKEVEAEQAHIKSIKARMDNLKSDYSKSLSEAKDDEALMEPVARAIPSLLNRWAGLLYLTDKEPDPFRRKAYWQISIFLACVSLIYGMIPLVTHIIADGDYIQRIKAMIIGAVFAAKTAEEANTTILNEIREPKPDSDVIKQDAKQRAEESNSVSDDIITDRRGPQNYGNGIHIH